MTGLQPTPQSRPLTSGEVSRMEMRVMSIGCTDTDFRWLMDSHEQMRGLLRECRSWLGMVTMLTAEARERLTALERRVNGAVDV